MMAPISREAESQDRIGRELMAWAVTVGLPCSSEPDSDTSLYGVRYLPAGGLGSQKPREVSFLKWKTRVLKRCSMR